jgi:hypothetical protein
MPYLSTVADLHVAGSNIQPLIFAVGTQENHLFCTVPKLQNTSSCRLQYQSTKSSPKSLDIPLRI